MRNIKFRAYGKIDCYYLTIDGWKPEYKMCEVSSLNIKTNKCRVLYKGEKNTNEYDTFILSKVNLMQFTGLKDKNGVDIYDGDILGFEKNYNSKIIFHEGSFGYETDGFFCTIYETNLSIAQVIGNIYENPELLK